MQLSYLTLVRCFFTKIQIEATSPEAPRSQRGTLETNTEIVPIKKETDSWRVTLTVRLKSASGSEPSPYVGELKIVGVFQVIPEYPAEERETLVAVNAPAVLYGMAREMISNITARGPYPMVCLPTVTFIDQAPEQIAKSSKHLSASDGKNKTTDTKENLSVKAKREKK